MDRILPFFRLKSSSQVLVALVLITLVSVAAPVVSLAVAMSFMPGLPSMLYWIILALCVAIPLLIAPPISLAGLSMLRLLTITIDRLDDYVCHDALTGVLSRAYLLGRIRELLRGGGSFLMVDADHFKAVNDTYGHDIGDEALKRLAEVLQTSLPTDALVGRLGGEEFGVFLPGAASAEAALAAGHLCASMRKSGKWIAGLEIDLTVSIGVAEHLPDNPLEKTMKLADAALYHAKRSGRDRYQIARETDAVAAMEPAPAFHAS